jgi:L-rhamnose mutarotase
MTQRSAFVLRVRPDKIEEYVRAHREVWPEMLDAIRGAGIRNYTIFRDGSNMFGYFEADDLAAAGRYLAEQEVSDYQVAHTTLGRWFKRPQVASQLRAAKRHPPTPPTSQHRPKLTSKQLINTPS